MVKEGRCHPGPRSADKEICGGRVARSDEGLNFGGRKMNEKDMIKIRILLQDFTTSYRRRNVTPREGLGMLEPSKFVYKGA